MQIHFGFILILSSTLSIDEFELGVDLEINIFELLFVGLAYVDCI